LISYIDSFYSGKVTRITPEDSYYSWSALALDGNNVLAGNYSCKLVGLSKIIVVNWY
jgi:hypothetical protein